MMRNIVIKIGGSLLFANGKINVQKISEFCNVIKSNNDYDSLVIICGGGIIARDYINAVRYFKGSEALCDLFGIEISRINSKLIIASLSNLAYPQVPRSIEELSIAKLSNKIVVMGGLQPGQSTTSVSAEVAEYINADELLVLTDIDGIYDKDPKKYKDAKLLRKLNYNELQEIILKSSGPKQAAAGEYRVFDVVSLQILRRSQIKAIVMNGKQFNEFKKFWHRKNEIIGTIVSN